MAQTVHVQFSFPCASLHLYHPPSILYTFFIILDINDFEGAAPSYFNAVGGRRTCEWAQGYPVHTPGAQNPHLVVERGRALSSSVSCEVEGGRHQAAPVVP
jgi:hypothetical protein